MGNEVSIQQANPSKPIVHPAKHVPLRLRRQHPLAFEAQTIFLGPLHSDEEWNDCFDAKALHVSSALCASKSSQPGSVQPWNAISKSLAEIESVAGVITRGSKKEELFEHDAQLLEVLQFALRGMRGIGDSVFLVLCFLGDLLSMADSPKSFVDKYGEAAINDIVKLDNQLPLDLIREIVARLPSAIKAMGSTEIQILGTGPETFLPQISEANFAVALQCFCKFYSPFSRNITIDSDYLKRFVQQKCLLGCLHLTVSGEFQSETEKLLPETAEKDFPTAKEIVRAGIRFETEGIEEIARIRFDNGILRLPALVVDVKSETVIRNLMVLEASYKEKPVSRYVRFLNEIVENGDDIALLKKSGVLRGKLGRDERVAEFIKSLDDCYCTPDYFPIDKTLLDLQSFYGEKMREYQSKMTIFTVSFICLGLLIRLLYLWLH